MSESLKNTPTQANEDTKKRKKAHFARNQSKKLNTLPDDVIEIIIMRCLLKHGNIIQLFMMSNKALNQRLLHKHDLWEQMYIRWMQPVRVRLYKSVPNMQILRRKTLHQPVDVQTLLDFGIPENNRLHFAKWMNKVNSLHWLSKCHCCKSMRRTVHAFWYMNKGFCGYCIPNYFISNQVLRSQYGIHMDSEVTCINSGVTKMFAKLVVNRVYFFAQHANKVERDMLTTAIEDFVVSNEEILFFFCIEDLQKVVDLEACRKEYQLRREAVQTLWRRMDPVVQLCRNIRYTKDGERLTNDKSSQVVVLLNKMTKICMNRQIKQIYQVKPKIDYKIDRVSRILLMNDRFKLEEGD